MPLTNHDLVRYQSGAEATAVQTLRVISEPPGNRASPRIAGDQKLALTLAGVQHGQAATTSARGEKPSL